MDAAINEMPDDFVIKGFLVTNRAEGKGMFLTEYDEEKMKEQERKEAVDETNERVATDMLKERIPLKTIIKIRLSEERIRELAKSIGAAVL